MISVAATAQTYLVKGKVADAHNHIPLPGTQLIINGKTYAVSSHDGTFRFNIKNGTYTLMADHPECTPQSVTLNANKDLDIEIFLEHHEREIERVNLTGKQKVSSNLSVSTLGKRQIDENSSQNLGNILSAVSGVNTLKTGNNIAKPIIHGLYGSRILLLNNGVKMAEQEWGVEHAPSVDANAFETLNVVKGAGALKYGSEAMGGAVVMEPKQFPARDTIMGSIAATYNSNGRGGNTVAELAKTWTNNWFVKTQGSYKRLGDISTPKTTLQNTGTNENAFSFGVGNRSFRQGIELYYSGIYQNFGIFKGSHLGDSEDFLRALNSGQMLYTGGFSYRIEHPMQEVSHQLAKIDAYRRWNKFGKLTARYSFQQNRRKEYDIRRGAYNLLPSMDLRLITHQAQLIHLLERENWKLESGITGSIQDNFPNPATKARRLIPDYYRYDGGAFSVFEYSFSPKLRAEAGARYDYSYYDAYKYYDKTEWDSRFASAFPEYFISDSGSRVLTRPRVGFSNFSANLGLSYQPAEALNFKFNLARASRTPNAAELFADGLHHSAAIIERGNLAIGNEVAYQANLSVRGNLSLLQGFTFDINPHFLTSRSFINQNPSGVLITIRGIFPVWDYKQISARIYGLDVDTELKISSNLKWTAQYSTVHGDDLSNREPLGMMPPTNFKNALEISIPGLHQTFVKIENQTFLRQNSYPTRIVPVEVIENGTAVKKSIDLSTPPGGYALWNAAAGACIAKNLRADIGVTNVFNKTYREYLNRLRYFSDAPGRNWYLSLKYHF